MLATVQFGPIQEASTSLMNYRTGILELQYGTYALYFSLKHESNFILYRYLAGTLTLHTSKTYKSCFMNDFLTVYCEPS